jgi:serine/threonine-protein kinase RsbW
MSGRAESVLEIAPEIAQISRASGWLRDWCRTRAVDDGVRRDLDLALDELLANAIDYGGLPPGVPIRLALSLLEDRVRLEIRDRGIAFDPRTAPDPDGAPEDGEGGVGLELVRRVVDRLDYAREAGENRLVIEKGLTR